MAPRPKATPRVGGEAVALELELPLAATLSLSRPLEAHFHASEGMVLLREASGVTGFFAGSLGTLAVEEVFAHVLSGIRSGQLTVQNGAVRRTVSFRDGQVVFATSTEKWERLGAVLVSLGMLTQDQLIQALARVTPTRRIGQVLTSEGRVSEASLYSAMTYVVREIILGLFEMTEGSFLFLEGPAPLADVVKLPERTRDLVLIGMKRSEELGRLRRRYPDDARLVAGTKGPPAGSAVAALLAKSTEGVTPLEVRAARDAGGLHGFYTWLDEAVREGQLKTRPVEAPESEAGASSPGATVAAPKQAGDAGGVSFEGVSAEERYNLLLSLVHRTLREAGQDVDLLRGFLDAPPSGLEDAYAGVTLGPDGRVDVGRLRANVAGGDEALSRALVLEALDAFVAYALFSARNVLTPEVAEPLSDTYRRLQGGLT